MTEKRSTLLIVDDTPDNIHVLMEALPGYSIKVARDGPKALALAGADPLPDLILLDIMMPGMDGYEVCRRLKDDPRTCDIPVIFITAKTREEDETVGLELGAVDYIAKPVSLPIVQARVRNHLELKLFREVLANQNEILKEKVRERTIKLATALERAEEAAKAKMDFLANMSHEIRTPFNGVMGVLQLVRDDFPDTAREYLDMAFHSGKRLEQLLTNILDMVSLDSGIAETARKPMLLKDVMLSVEHLFRLAADQKGVRLTMSLDERIPEKLLGDATRIQQILFNVVGNAVKFTDQGGEIELGATLLRGKPRVVRVLFSVTDTGIGMTDKVTGAVFEDFSQLEESVLTRRYQGAGLGLSIVRRLVHMLHGEACVSGEPGKGTEFYCSLPIEEYDPAYEYGTLGPPPEFQPAYFTSKKIRSYFIAQN